MSRKLYRSYLKRTLDILAALFGLAISLPIFLILLPLLSYSNNGPVFFTQVRPGIKGRAFRLIKLKTMNDKRDHSGNLLPDRERITVIGRIVRSMSLDELPQLINVIKGEMSFVGPRPLLTEYLPLYNTRQARRHEVRPGLTGWAQVNGRNNLKWEQKFEYDIWYVENFSFRIDVKIMVLTIYKIFIREGINLSDAHTMKPFTG